MAFEEYQEVFNLKQSLFTRETVFKIVNNSSLKAWIPPLPPKKPNVNKTTTNLPSVQRKSTLSKANIQTAIQTL